MARRLTEEQKAIMRAIEANNTTIRQLRMTNRHLANLLPDFSKDERGRIRDPRTGQDVDYKNGKGRGRS